MKIELRISKVYAKGESLAGIGPSLTLVMLWGRRKGCSSQVVLPVTDGVCLFSALGFLTAHWWSEIGHGGNIYTTDTDKH